MSNDLLKSRATAEDLLGLPIQGWEAIASMSDEQLASYLSDITAQEPVGIPQDSQPNGYEEPKAPKTPKPKRTKTSADIEQEIDSNPNNPITSKKTKQKQIADIPANIFDDLLED